jgi:hypothetical protein
MSDDGSWKFVWSTAHIAGIDKLVTARYTITAFDLSDPQKTASVQIFLKRPEFYINPQPGPVPAGEYIQLSGVAEKGVTNVKIDISDSAGKILNTHTAPVSTDGFFNYEFRGITQPGQYYVSAGNPSMKNTLRSTFTVISSGGLSPKPTSPLPEPGPQDNLTTVPSPSPVLTKTITPVPSATPLSPLAVIAGLIVSGFLVLTGSTGQRKH